MNGQRTNNAELQHLSMCQEKMYDSKRSFVAVLLKMQLIRTPMGITSAPHFLVKRLMLSGQSGPSLGVALATCWYINNEESVRPGTPDSTKTSEVLVCSSGIVCVCVCVCVCVSVCVCVCLCLCVCVFVCVCICV